MDFLPLDIEKTGLKKETLESIQQCIGHFPEVTLVVLYGSRAKGCYQTGSDIDLTFLGEKLKQDTLNKIDWALDDLLTPYSFDLSLFSSIENQNLIEHITRVGMVFFKRPCVR